MNNYKHFIIENIKDLYLILDFEKEIITIEIIKIELERINNKKYNDKILNDIYNQIKKDFKLL